MTWSSCVRGALAAGALSALAPAAAWAQQAPPTPPAAVPVDEARQLFEQGVRAMQRQEWPAALTAFEGSMRLRRSASVALNLGVVLREMGRFVEARVRLQEFNELATPEQQQTHHDEVTRLTLDLSRRLARVRVLELTPPSAVVTIDGRRAQLNEAGEVSVDPGTRSVRAEAQGYLPFEERIEVAESATREIRVALAPQPAAAPAPTPVVVTNVTPHAPPAAVAPESHPFYTRWWFWTIVGVAVAGGVTTGVVLATQPAPLAFPETSTGNRFVVGGQR